MAYLTRAEKWAVGVGVAALLFGAGLYGYKLGYFSEASPPQLLEIRGPKRARPSPLVVHVAGAVRRPGVYQLPQGSRVADAIRKAGGPRKDADLDSVNLAAFLEDGQKVFVAPKIKPTTLKFSPRRKAARAKVVNVNLASASELEALPGIGPVIARRIVEYRRSHGPFRRPEDLLNVKGIGPKKLARIKPYIRF